MARRFSFRTVDRPIIGQVNTTPLIDVMLVLLILCVISIPAMTHKVPINLSGVEVSQHPPAIYRLDLESNGALRWNGTAIALKALPQRLAMMKRDPDSTLEINASGTARYQDFDRLLAVVKGSGVERVGFTGIDGFASDLDHER